jgi:glutamate synthase (NADPH/NADH) small chain
MGCPTCNLIPEWNDLVYNGQWETALRRLEHTNALPEITGRVCPAPCETSCTLSINSSPVTIKQIELAIIEHGFNMGWVKPVIPAAEQKEKIAVIGSGPAGLTAALTLRKAGFQVTVFEKSHEPGGILRYGIPDFKLEKWIIDRRIQQMKDSGIRFETDVNIGEDITYKYLKNFYDVLLLTTGAGIPRDLSVEGRNLGGIHFAMEYLTDSNKFVAGEKKTTSITAKGKNVLVIGGGDTGSDCIGTAVRQGAKKVYQFEIMPKPIEWKESHNPSWPNWPLILRTSSSHEEGVTRDWGILTKKFSGNGKNVSTVHCQRIEWKKNPNTGQMEFTEVKNGGFEIKAELVLLAMGFIHTSHEKLHQDMNIEFDKNGNILTNRYYATSQKGIFAAGDANTGASLVVRAIYHGQQAAKAIHKYLLSKGTTKSTRETS